MAVKLLHVIASLEYSAPHLRKFLNKKTGSVDDVVNFMLDAANTMEEEDIPDVVKQMRDIINDPDYIEIPDLFTENIYRSMLSFCANLDDTEKSKKLMSVLKDETSYKKFRYRCLKLNLLKEFEMFQYGFLKETVENWLKSLNIDYEDDIRGV